MKITHKKSVLLLTSSNLSSNGIGSIFIHSFLDKNVDFDVTPIEEPPFLMSGQFLYFSSLSNLCMGLMARFGTLQSLRLFFFRMFLLSSRVKKIRSRADSVGASVIWITASSPELIWIGEELVKFGLDIRTMVWDAPEYIIQNLRLHKNLKTDILRAFSVLLPASKQVSVIGASMKSGYKDNYGVQSLVIRHGIEAKKFESSKENSDSVRIVFAGSLYAKDEWNSFVAALDKADWKINGKLIDVYFIGRFPLSGAYKPLKVNYLGEKSFNESLEIMSTMDIGYLPYWFSEKYSIVAKTSFPGKLSAYAAAGLAVFNHAPDYTEAAKFLEDYPFGITCASCDLENITQSLADLVKLSKTTVCGNARKLAYVNELSDAAMYTRFKMFLGSV